MRTGLPQRGVENRIKVFLGFRETLSEQFLPRAGLRPFPSPLQAAVPLATFLPPWLGTLGRVNSLSLVRRHLQLY